VFCPPIPFPGNACDRISFIVYSRFVNRPVTMVAIQTYYRPFFLLLSDAKQPIQAGIRLSSEWGILCLARPSKGQARQGDGRRGLESKLATCRL
jgi:hypothetical protein